MKAVRPRIVISILVILFVTIVALEYGRNNQWQTEAVAATKGQANEKSYDYWFPFVGERNGRSYLSLIVREHNPAVTTPTPILTGTPYPGPLTPTLIHADTATHVTPYPGTLTLVTPYPEPY